MAHGFILAAFIRRPELLTLTLNFSLVWVIRKAESLVNVCRLVPLLSAPRSTAELLGEVEGVPVSISPPDTLTSEPPPPLHRVPVYFRTECRVRRHGSIQRTWVTSGPWPVHTGVEF